MSVMANPTIKRSSEDLIAAAEAYRSQAQELQVALARLVEAFPPLPDKLAVAAPDSSYPQAHVQVPFEASDPNRWPAEAAPRLAAELETHLTRTLEATLLQSLQRQLRERQD
mmetsp:Transcript_62261/g.115561  ORF Transcript_62261/g.115561 Transcript_62261/m.115561 type:complete len:112 (-) Transcript_62261:144-479(-)